MTLKLMLITSITQITLVLYNNDEAGIIVLASSFCITAVLCHFYVKRVVSQCASLALLEINERYV